MVLHPTRGIPASSSTPCTVPSSPFFPCRIGNAPSKGNSSTPSCFSSKMPCSPLSGETATGIQSFASSQAPPGIFAGSPWYRYHFPSLEIPIITNSYASVSIWVITAWADCRETSCSLEHPPNKTATLFLCFFSDIFFSPLL